MDSSLCREERPFEYLATGDIGAELFAFCKVRMSLWGTQVTLTALRGDEEGAVDGLREADVGRRTKETLSHVGRYCMRGMLRRLGHQGLYSGQRGSHLLFDMRAGVTYAQRGGGRPSSGVLLGD